MNFKTAIGAAALGTALLSSTPAMAADWASYECGDSWGPVKQVAPSYPKRARDRGLEGYIVMSFSISPEGKVENIAVKDAQPEKAFVRAATHALTETEFQPCVSNGVAVQVTDVSIKYDFNLR